MSVEAVAESVRWLSFRLRRRASVQVARLRRRVFAPRGLPVAAGGKVLIHLGCGDIDSPEFVNVDALPLPHVHYRRDVSDLSVFPDDHADLVYACHVLEHFPPEAHRKVLWEWHRVTRPGGILRLSVPDFDKLLVMYRESGEDVRAIVGPLMGTVGQGYRNHCAVFNDCYLRAILAEAGFHETRAWDPARVEHHAFDDWASRGAELSGRVFPISLNIEAVK